MALTIPSYKCLISISILYLIHLSPVLGIKCWVCNSNTDPKCADPFDNSSLPIKDCREVKYQHLTESDQLELDDYNYKKQFPNLFPYAEKPRPVRLKEATMCRKIRQKIHGNWRILRSCAFLGSPGEGSGNEHNCLYRQGTHDIYLEYCTCNSKDGCNTGPFDSPKTYVITSFIVISIVISMSL